ncbi:CheW protein [Nitrosospira multiformis ATCC 25196]|uniref:CheW protein n=1 Tax=Nitrosospira multiformis (strain ATCC 25196 / NCIMB 11849 / C 71) TaxID=323848 RepID=Q2YC82_NITMU|nr:chemotaxis protein CheW [Nitrosospira multiformis]ABB73639.1 CheW protein [Nitrosospira multiformis ATCC 25196]SEF39219.1 CheW protein [Nitrosospira multiformis ATCC 25196]
MASGNSPQLEQNPHSPRATVDSLEVSSKEKIQQILQARALALAQELSAQEVRNEDVEIVEFILGCERYALESCYVIQVAEVEDITPLPCTPGFIRGIVTLRGEILPVIDLKKFFEVPEKELGGRNKVIVLQSGKMTFSILVDEVLGARFILATDIQSSLPTLMDIRKKYLKGITSERLVVLDAENLLMDESIVVDEQVVE